jgi:Entner-Doudoroff aldolase
VRHASAQNWFNDDFFKVPIIAVLRGLSPSDAVQAATRAWDAGVRHVEVTVETPAAVPTLAAVARAASDRGAAVGAGTVTSVEQLDAAAAAEASFTVSPGLDERVVRESIRRGLPHLPGVSTAGDILRAKGLGLTWVKAFPASLLGTEWVKAMKGPFPDVKFVATGGMRVATAQTYLEDGVSVVGLSAEFASDKGAEAVKNLLVTLAAS